MSRIPNHTIADAPAGSRQTLTELARSSPNGRFLNLHAQMAHSPAVLAGYMALRAAAQAQSGFDPRTAAALTLATAGAVGNGYMIAIATRLGQMAGLSEEDVAALRTGMPTKDAKLDTLTRVAREAAVDSGKVADTTWAAAEEAGWTSEQLAQVFSYLALTVFTGYFLNYAKTEIDGLW